MTGAIRCFDEAARHDIGLVDAFLLRATAINEYANTSNGQLPPNFTIQDALRDADYVLQFKPDSGEAHLQRGYALSRLERDEEADQAFEAAVPLLADPAPALIHTALAAFRRDDPQLALRQMDQVIDRHPSEPDYHAMRSVYRLAVGDKQGSMEDDAEASRGLAEIAYQAGSIDVYQEVEQPEAQT